MIGEVFLHPRWVFVRVAIRGILFCCGIFGFILTPVAYAKLVDNEACFACHSDPSAGKVIDPQKFEASIHFDHRCTSCHTDIDGLPHDIPLKSVSCATCHQIETEVYLGSDHGKALKAGVSEAASCRDCHGDAHVLLDSRDPDSPVFRANVPTTCAQCHEKVEEMARFHLGQPTPIVSYGESVHGLGMENGVVAAAVCTDCHGSHDLHRGTDPSSRLYWQTIPSTCGSCHDEIHQAYLGGVHGQAVLAGKREAPVCTDCHGEHSIAGIELATSSVFPSHIQEICGQCHSAERVITKYQLPAHVVETYMESFHGLALQLGSVTAANCASCHGAHEILPSSDPKSSVHPKNLAKTCGICHPGVSAQVTKGQIHSGMRPGLEHRVVWWVRHFYLVLIFFVIGGMLVHNALDFRRKLRAHYQQAASMSERVRMELSERIQHAILIVVFLALTYTGFALKFPQTWWASPFIGETDWRGLVHRGAAAIFCLLVVYHAWFIFFTKRGRQELKALLPRCIDLIQPFEMLGYYLGLRKTRPIFAKYSYVEKSEYWALVWGSVIMVVTGVLMIWEGWTLRVFPKWSFDVVTAIHYYEAILACTAIIVWHLYWVIFDPGEYPMKWTWITGRDSRSDRAHRRDEDTSPPSAER